MTSQETQRILFVDDEQALLDGLNRRLRRDYSMATACGAQAGLRKLDEDGPFAVVVTDFQMPDMNGTQFLAEVHKAHPDIVRVMLTGQADLQTAIDAVNRGHIFRFLSKPCEADVLRSCLDASLDQFRLRHAEQNLLEQTLRGSVEVMAGVLALSHPAAFGRATRIQGFVKHMVQHLRLENGWQYETAALLSQVGYVAIPDDLLERVAAGEDLSPGQLAMMERHPQVARDLLLKIPRLEKVAEMVFHQRPHDATPTDPAVVLGGRMLGAALDFEELLAIGASPDQAVEALRKEEKKYGKGILAALSTAATPGVGEGQDAVTIVSVHKLRVGMVLQENVRSKDGNLIVPSGHSVTLGSIQRLRNYAELDRLEKLELPVHVPADDTWSGGSAAA